MAVRRGRNVKEPLSGKKRAQERFMSMALFPWHFRQSVKRFLRIGHGKKRIVSLQERLSWSLFGSVDTAGCQVDFGGKTYTVTAVIDKEEMVMFLTADEEPCRKRLFPSVAESGLIRK